MKQNLLFLGLFLAMTSLSAQAQTTPARKPVQPKGRPVSMGITLKDGFTVKEGKVLVTQQAQTNPLTKEFSLVNGTKIHPDGTVTMADGSSTLLREGDYLSLGGRLSTAEAKAQQDSLMRLTQANAKGKPKKKKS